jgi:hypothetical protein
MSQMKLTSYLQWILPRHCRRSLWIRYYEKDILRCELSLITLQVLAIAGLTARQTVTQLRHVGATSPSKHSTFLSYLQGGQYALEGSEYCPLNVCCSQYGFCGTSTEFCSDSCQNNCVSDPPVPSGASSADVLSKVIGYYEGW